TGASPCPDNQRPRQASRHHFRSTCHRSSLPMSILVTLFEHMPAWYMCAHQCLEHPAMACVAQMKQLVDDDVVLEALMLLQQIDGQGDGSGRGTGAPLSAHLLDSNDARVYTQFHSPGERASSQFLRRVEGRLHASTSARSSRMIRSTTRARSSCPRASTG